MIVIYIIPVLLLILTIIQLILSGNLDLWTYLITWDKSLNYLFPDAFNWLFQRDGYKFGHTNETISSALGKNQLDGTLTKFGKFMVWFLNILDKNHCI